MFKYVGKRLLASTITLIIILTTVFVLMRQMPIEGYFDNFDKVDQAVAVLQANNFTIIPADRLCA